MYEKPLDKYGHKWVIVDKDYKKTPMKFVCIYPDGTQKIRMPDYYESFGNHAAIVFRANGEKYHRLPENYKIDNMMVVDLRKRFDE